MTPEALLEKLESLGTVDSGVLKKLRRTVENPKKDSSVKKILTYLVKNDYLTRKQAIELKKPTQPKIVEQNSDDLTAGVLSSSSHSVVEHGQSEVISADVEEPIAQPVEVLQDINPDVVDTMVHDPVAPIYDAPADFEDPMAASFGQVADAPTEGRTFTGKIDSSDQWATKWVFVGFATLGFLLMAGTLLFFFLSMISAVERFEAATQSFENGTYGDAIKKFEEFIEKHPSHEKIPLAKVKLVQSLLADTFKQRNWDETIVRAEKNLPELLEDDEIDLEPIRQDLSVILPNATLELARRATKQEAKSDLVSQLAKAKNAKRLVDDPIYIPNSKRKQATVAQLLDDINEEIAKGDGLIRKQDDFDQAMTQIASLRSSGETEKAFTTYNDLIREYGDLRANKQLDQEMRLVSQMESKLVKSISPAVSIENSIRVSPIKSSYMLASQNGKPIESLRGEAIPYLVDGSVFGIDMGDGGVLWRHHVGFQSNIEPIKVSESQVLISDRSKNDLLLVGAADGKVVWRSEIGEAFLQPQVDESQILLTTDSGKVMRLDLATGSVTSASQIPQTANMPMVRSPRTGLIIQPGFYSNLYLLSGEDLTCKDVFYLGHRRGAITTPPVVWNNMILVAVNQAGVCDLHIIGPSEDGGLQPVQRIRRVTRGLVTNPMVRFGRFMLITSESGDIKILELNTADENSPVRILAEEKFENSGGTRIHLTTGGSQLWVGARGITRYKVSRALGVFERQKFAATDDYFTGPIRKFGEAIVHVRKRSNSAQTSISAVDGITLEEIWRTDLGGPLAGPPIVTNNAVTAISSQGDVFEIEDTNTRVAKRISRASTINEEFIFNQTFELSPTTRACIGPAGRPELLHVDTQQGTSKLMRLPPPANQSACESIQIGSDLIVPSKQGQVVRVDPSNGRVVGTPFLPPVSPGDEMKWKTPAVIGGSFFVIAADKVIYLIDASDKNVLKQVGELAAEGMVKSQLAAGSSQAFAVVAGNPTDNLISIAAGQNGLQPGASVDLGGLMLAGPWVVGDDVLVRMGDNSLISFDSNLSRKWSIDLGPGMLGEEPSLAAGNIKLIFSDGRIRQLDPAAGSIVGELDLGQPVAHRPIATDSGVLYTGLDGTIHNAQKSN